MPVDATTAHPEFTPFFPGYAEKVQRAFAQQGMMQAIGARLVALSPGRCSIELPFATA